MTFGELYGKTLIWTTVDITDGRNTVSLKGVNFLSRELEDEEVRYIQVKDGHLEVGVNNIGEAIG